MGLFDNLSPEDLEAIKLLDGPINKCPFCGNKAVGNRDTPETIYIEFRALECVSTYRIDYFVHCQRCWAHGPFKDSIIEAVCAWNEPTREVVEKKHIRKGLIGKII